MKPHEYERAVAEYYRAKGYVVEETPASGDWGVDCFAEQGDERLAIQVKIYGHTGRKVNRQMVMELHGAKDFFDCTRAVIATDGTLRESAARVAEKLGIEIFRFVASGPPSRQSAHRNATFDAVWEVHIMPLKGKTIRSESGRTNVVVDVDWGGLTRLTSSGRKQTIPIEVFRQTVTQLIDEGRITRDAINQSYAKRASSGVVLILSQVPGFEASTRPTGLRLADFDDASP